MTFHHRPAVRESTFVLLGLAGSSGSGKTLSGLRVGSGLGKKLGVVDTENGRALHYADDFKFEHGELREPFTPKAYAEAITTLAEAGCDVIMVDSASHEHAGDGGLLDWHEAELDRMAGDDFKRREAMTFSAWVKPKMSHKKDFLNTLLSVRAHVILCFRAEEKIEIVKNPQTNKMEVRPKKTATGKDGWVPISEKNLPYEMTASFLLLATDPGIPHPIKLQEQHKPFVDLSAPLDESAGEKLAKWAAGDKSAAGVPPSEHLAPAAGALSVEDIEKNVLKMAEELGANVSATKGSITASKNKRSPEEYAEWIKRQHETLEKAKEDAA